ncbi:MAG: ion transporter [Myxococcales bacterium]|nr:ion transporter [Myxococcales bacterium]
MVEGPVRIQSTPTPRLGNRSARASRTRSPAASESVASVAEHHGLLLRVLEWVYTVLFSVEYGLRIYCARRRLRYVVSFFGVIDLLALLPTYLSLFFSGVHTLAVIRALRLLRVFRVLKAVRLMGEAHSLLTAVRLSLPKISVFLGAVMVIALVVGSAMYLIEGEEAGFTSIPRAMYWAIVTMTTVGYGDIAPRTELGQFLAAILMVLGYGILAVPTGIVSAEIVGEMGHKGTAEADASGKAHDDEDGAVCHACGARGHQTGANFCYVCGSAVD